MCVNCDRREGERSLEVECPKHDPDYIAKMCTELKRMAERAGFKLLGYFLSLAELEAQLQARSVAPPTIQPSSTSGKGGSAE